MTPFDKAFDALMLIEGGYSNSASDKGGETKYGISRRSYPHLKIADLTLVEARQIYLHDFWLIIHLDMIRHPDVAGEIFEQAVNFGPGEAVEIAQRALGYLGKPTLVDGVMGPVTREALNSYPHKDALLKTLNGFQFMRYVEIVKADPRQKENARGWLRRIEI